jgi:sRNA-binding carbon storage regulator CsrA
MKAGERQFAVKAIDVEQKAGYLVLRLKPGAGAIIMECIEIRLASVSGSGNEAQIAIKAPKEIKIRRIK